jgi:hypothetical protein
VTFVPKSAKDCSTSAVKVAIPQRVGGYVPRMATCIVHQYPKTPVVKPVEVPGDVGSIH